MSTPSLAAMRAAKRICAFWSGEESTGFQDQGKIDVAVSLLRLRKKVDPVAGAEQLWELLQANPEMTLDEKINAAAVLIDGLPSTVD